MQNRGEGEEERREETVITPEYSPDYTRVMIDEEKPTKAFGICPGDFEEIPPHYEWHLLPKQKCFYLHKDSTGTVSLQTFSEAQKICEEKNSTIFDPTSLHEGNRINKWIQNQTDSWPDVDVRAVWINYQDMDMKASLIQTGAVLVDSKYMGSLGSLNKIPSEYWAPNAGGTHDLSKYHCAQWAPTGVFKTTCDSIHIAVVCEAAGSSKPHTLRKYLTSASYAGSEEERRGTSMMQNGPGGAEKRCDAHNPGPCGKRGTSMMQNGKRADGPTNMMQNGDSGKRADSTNMMQNGDSGKREPFNMMQNGKRADGPTNMMQNGKREEAPVIAKRHPGAGWEESERME